jgi:hypothetical protein
MDDKWLVYDIEMETSLNNDEAHIFMLESGALFLVRIKEAMWRMISNIEPVLDRLPKNTSVGAVRWKSEFRISHRIIRSFQKENIFFAGDAAHIHSGLGARGMI